MSRFKKIFLGLVAILVLFTAVGFFVLPPILQSVLTNQMTKALDRPVSIKEIKINPYLLTVTVRGLEIRERKAPDVFVSFEELSIDLDGFSVFRRALCLEEVRLVKPYARIIRHPDNAYNFSDLLTKFGKKKVDEKEKKETFHFSLNNIRVEGGSLDFVDGPVKVNHKISDLMITIPFISNTPYHAKRFTQPTLSAKINGASHALYGQTKPFSDALETELNVDMTDLNIPHYMAYVPVKLNVRLISAFLDTKIRLTYTQPHNQKTPTLKVTGDMGLKQLAVDDNWGRPLIRLPMLAVSIASVEPFLPRLHFSKIILTSPQVAMVKGRQGELNFLPLTAPSGQKPLPAASPGGSQKDVKKPSPPVPALVDEIRIDQGKVTFKDEKPSPPISLALNNLNLQVKDFTTAKEGKATLTLSAILDKQGQISASGSVDLEPLSADLQLKISRIPIRPVQAYFTDMVKINVTDGSVSASGNVIVDDLGGEKGLSVKYNGNFLMAHFSSIDKAHAEDFLKWKSLFFSDLRFQQTPLSVKIRQIALTDFFAKVVINEDGTLNLQNLMADKKGEVKEAPPSGGQKVAEAVKTPESKPVAKASPPEKAEAAAIKIDAITLQGGTVDFTDRYIKPNYAANLSQIGGRISGLSSLDEKPADVEFRGRFNNHLPLEITGRVHPLKKEPLVDLKASFKDMDLSPISPYSGKHIGYKIEKGKLSFDLKYLIVNKKLESENKIFIDQLTLGEPVESPEALKLPIGLAIALLRDRHGQINLDVPVSGTTDDPQFSIGRLIIQVIVNLLTKAVTAPFALLGSLFGGGEELSYVEFDYGRTNVTEGGQKKIESLIKALYERPSLRLDIVGHADPEQDREGLKNYSIERKVKALKLNDRIKQGLAAVSLDEVVVEPQEYEKYLTLAYLAEKFPKPRTAVGAIKTLPVPEMEKLMLTNTMVGEGDLKLLAAQRASAVYDLILKNGQVPPERVFIIEPKSLSEKKEKVKDSRVDFKLK